MQLEHRECAHDDDCAAEQPVEAFLGSPSSMTMEGNGQPMMPNGATQSRSGATVQPQSAGAAFEGQQRLQFGSFDDSIPLVPQVPVAAGAL